MSGNAPVWMGPIARGRPRAAQLLARSASEAKVLLAELLAVLKSLIDLATVHGVRRIGRTLATPFLTLLMLIATYTSYHIIRERSISAGFQVAFLASQEDIEVQARLVRAAVLQAALQQSLVTESLINQLVQVALNDAPTAARAQLGVIHDGVTGLTGVDLLKFDITNALASPGRVAGDLTQDEPLSAWSDYLPQLMAGHCAMLDTSKIINSPGRARLLQLGAVAFLACPVTDVRNRILGALFIQWDARDGVPNGEALETLSKNAINLGAQIASALDSRLMGATR